jgi:chromosome segregation protein
MARLERGSGRRRVEAGELRRLAARSQEDAVAADASAAELDSEAAGIGQGDVQAAEDAAARAEAALSSALGARRAHADAEGQAANVRRELEAATARAAELTERHVALNDRSAATTEQLHEADAEATTLAGRLEAARLALVEAEGGAQSLEADVEAAREADRAARTTAAAAADAEQLAGARLQALEAAVQRGEGLSASARALQEGGARLVVEGVEAEPGFERAVAAALGWRAGAVVAERIDDAIGMIGAAEGELAIVLAGRVGAHASGSAGRPLTEVCTVHDDSLAPLIEGIRLVDYLKEVKSVLAVSV